MTEVLTPLHLDYRGGRRFVLLSPFVVKTDIAGLITVAAGEPTDMNSVPFGLWNILPPWDFGEAAAVHDDLYYRGEIDGVKIPRLIADGVHRELILWTNTQGTKEKPREHAPAWKRIAYYDGLRVGGWRTWAKYRAGDAERIAAERAIT